MNSKGYQTVAPWMNPDQFIKVYKYLYSKSISNKRWAVDQIAVWETRCFPALPVAVEATVVLVRALIQDMLFEVEKTFCLEGDIQMLYSMALIRFVNVIVEQHKNVKFGRGITILGMEQNIPSWIIDLRHEASHSYCPSLPTLRMGAERALQYLEDTFWKPEAANVQSIINVTNKQEDEIYILITKYKNLQFEKLEKSNITSRLNNDMKPILRRIYYFIENHWRIFLNILVQPDIFTAAEDLIRLLNLSSDTLYLKEKELSPLPFILEEFWLPILVLIHHKDKIPHFLENLLIAQEKCKISICQKTAIAWAMQIVFGPSPTSPLGTCFQKKGLLLDFHKLLYACLKSTNQYSSNLCKVIVEKLGSTEKYTHLFTIMALKSGMLVHEEQNSQRSKPNKEIIFTIEDVLEDLNEIKRNEKPNTCKDNIWSVAPVHMDFSNIPLGAVLNQNSEMELEESEENEINIETSDENFIILNENDDEGTIEVTVNRKFPASFHPEQFGMLYNKS